MMFSSISHTNTLTAVLLLEANSVLLNLPTSSPLRYSAIKGKHGFNFIKKRLLILFPTVPVRSPICGCSVSSLWKLLIDPLDQRFRLELRRPKSCVQWPTHDCIHVSRWWCLQQSGQCSSFCKSNSGCAN